MGEPREAAETDELWLIMVMVVDREHRNSDPSDVLSEVIN